MTRAQVQGFNEAQKAIRKAAQQTVAASAAAQHNPDQDCARRIHEGGRIVVLPPEGHGDVWRGGGA